MREKLNRIVKAIDRVNQLTKGNNCDTDKKPQQERIKLQLLRGVEYKSGDARILAESEKLDKQTPED